eukprot:6819203-Alexandrium_andersonii.AAC.1
MLGDNTDAPLPLQQILFSTRPALARAGPSAAHLEESLSHNGAEYMSSTRAITQDSMSLSCYTGIGGRNPTRAEHH